MTTAWKLGIPQLANLGEKSVFAELKASMDIIKKITYFCKKLQGLKKSTYIRSFRW